ncbi:unnamed protein product [Meloidogyne enterolobii]|uniref:Uncharacterized protein n=1 Tax=Meloidogyne enterolobii TaxID=390850 RepID=A0ACB1B775_MELEN
MTCPYLSGRTMINIHEDEVKAEINQINDESSRQSEQLPSISSSVSDGVYKAAIFTDQISYNGYLQVKQNRQ